MQPQKSGTKPSAFLTALAILPMLSEVASKGEVQQGTFRQKYQQFRKQQCQSVQSSVATRWVFTQEKPILLKAKSIVCLVAVWFHESKAVSSQPVLKSFLPPVQGFIYQNCMKLTKQPEGKRMLKTSHQFCSHYNLAACPSTCTYYYFQQIWTEICTTY